jgi:flagellar assembly factor FliW
MTMLPPDLTRSTRQITLVEPMPGFPGLESYDFSAIDDQGVLYSLRSTDEPGLRFILTPANTFFPDYAPRLPATVRADVGDDVYLLLVVTVQRGLADATANLRAPVALSATSDRAVQVVLEDEALPMREPLLPH